jgi:hypothetical protein
MIKKPSRNVQERTLFTLGRNGSILAFKREVSVAEIHPNAMNITPEKQNNTTWLSAARQMFRFLFSILMRIGVGDLF